MSVATRLAMDIGHSSTKNMANNTFSKIPTSVSYYTDSGIDFGEKNVYEFEGEKYVIGEAANEEAFATTDYSFLQKIAPVVAYHVIKKLGLSGPIELRTGLSLTDWNHKDEFVERLRNITVNGETIETYPRVVGPQGDGAYTTYLIENNLTEHPRSMVIIEIGYRTINFLLYENGVPQQNKCQGFPGHGVVSIINPFRKYLESKYKMPFSEQEALKIFTTGSLTLGGVTQDEIPLKIAELKNQFVQKLMKSILVSEKKTLMFAEKVLIAGGGVYFLRDVPFPNNVVWNNAPYEMANVYGYYMAK